MHYDHLNINFVWILQKHDSELCKEYLAQNTKISINIENMNTLQKVILQKNRPIPICLGFFLSFSFYLTRMR